MNTASSGTTIETLPALERPPEAATAGTAARHSLKDMVGPIDAAADQSITLSNFRIAARVFERNQRVHCHLQRLEHIFDGQGAMTAQRSAIYEAKAMAWIWVGRRRSISISACMYLTRAHGLPKMMIEVG